MGLHGDSARVTCDFSRGGPFVASLGTFDFSNTQNLWYAPQPKRFGITGDNSRFGGLGRPGKGFGVWARVGLGFGL